MQTNNINLKINYTNIHKHLIEIGMLSILSIISIYSRAQVGKSIPNNGITETKMVNPDIDNPDKPWCYLQKSTTTIGVPYMPDAVQVTYDGSIYTRKAELCFFYGNPLKPVMLRQKWYLNGWIPIVEDYWKSHNICYTIEMFGFPLNGESNKNTIQFVRIRMTNKGHFSSRAFFTVATRSTGIDHRMGASEFSSNWIYGIESHQVIRNRKLIYTFSNWGHEEAIYRKEYSRPFRAVDLNVKKNTPVCLINYEPILKPGASVEFVFKMPRVPVDTTNKVLIHKIEDANYDSYRAETVHFWKRLILKGKATFEIPEKRVNDALRASLVHMVLATRERNGKRFMTDGLPYPNLFLASFVQHERAFDCFGFKEFVDQSLPSVYAKQDSDGLFYDNAVLHGKKAGVSHGQTIQALCEHYFLTRDKKYIDTAYPKIKSAIGWIEHAVLHDKYHLMPAVWPYDAEMILGHYTSHNLWAILGVRSAIRVARDLGKYQDTKAWLTFEKFYKDSLLKAIDTTFKEKGYVAPGLYKYAIGEAARPRFEDWQTNQNWENMMLVYPSELLSPDNPIVDSTLNYIRRACYREGIMTYRIYLHQYLTINMMDQELAIGDSKDALIDLYNVLLHLGSTYEGFENLVLPWQDRNISASVPPPHAWASSKLACFIRNMLIREYGGDAGLDLKQRNLYLFSLISPDWCKDGQRVSIHDARTEMGIVSATMSFISSGAIIRINPKFSYYTPHRIVLTVPYFVHLIKFKTDASKAYLKGRLLFLSPDVHKVQLTWKIDTDADKGTFDDILKRYRSESTMKVVNGKEVITSHCAYLLPDEKYYPPEPLSFDLVKKAFIHEYTLRFNKFKVMGGYVDTVAAPPLIPN